MVVIGTPVPRPSVPPTTFGTVEPAVQTWEGCPILVKSRSLVLVKGLSARARWPLRDREGHTVDISDYFPAGVSTSADENSLKVRIMPLGEPTQVRCCTADCEDAANGVISFALPTTVTRKAGIYRMEIGLFNADDEMVFLDSGIVSVDRSLWYATCAQRADVGPPTLQEIRMRIRDTAVENTLLQQTEFDDEEIAYAVVQPILEWNETTPHLRSFVYTPSTFPYRLHWIKAIIGYLLATAVHHYLRNKLQTSHGGLTTDDKNKNKEYGDLANQYLTEWRVFVARKKIELNAGQAYGAVTGPYY